MNKNIIIFLLCWVLTLPKVYAQAQWNWAARAGYHATGFNSTPYEKVVDMATDPNGNVYYLALIKGEGQSEITGYNGPINTYGADDMLLASYNCNGQYRWHKVIGGYAADMPLGVGALGVDTVGGVYVTSMVYSPPAGTNINNVHFGNDTMLAHGTQKGAFLVKYDTSGVFEWLRMPEPNNLFNEKTIFPRGMDVAQNGDAYIMAFAKPGVLSEGNITITEEGCYIFKYNANGVLTSHVKLNMQISFSPFTLFFSSLTRDHSSGRFYISGEYDGSATLKMGGNNITNSCVVGAFDAQGNYLWHKTNNKSSILGFYGRPQIDALGNITLLGNLWGGGGTPDGFNGYTTNAQQIYSTPFIVQLNPQGVNNWIVSAVSNYGINLFKGIKLVNNTVVVGGLMYPSRMHWTGSTDTIDITAPTLGLYRFDLATGNYLDTGSSLLRMSPSVAGFYNSFEAITSDKNGNVYVGGAFSQQLMLPNQSFVNNSGGPTDVFIAKYGFSCNCTPPTAAFTYVNTANNYNFTYSGTSPYNSIQWNFGDGSTVATTANATHQFANAGTYNVCVTVVNDCGENTYCQSITVNTPNAIRNIADLGKMLVYPNPATQQLHVEHELDNGTIIIANALGQTVYKAPISERTMAIDVATWTNGIYFIYLENNKGEQNITRFIKQ